MAHDGTIILENQPVGVLADLQPVLGTTYKSLETVGKYADTNMWSKWKPFRSSATSFADRNARKAALELANNGFFIDPRLRVTMLSVITTAYDAISALPDASKENWTDWSYNRPRGENNNPPEYFREMDWWGYNHAAVPPLRWRFEHATIGLNTNERVMQTGTFDMDESNFPILEGLNLGVAVRRSNGIWSYHIFASGERSVVMGIATGTYEALFFYTNKTPNAGWLINLDTELHQYIFCPTPYSKFEITSASSLASVIGLNPSVSVRFFRFELKVDNASLTNMAIAYRKHGHYSRATADTYTLQPQSVGESDYTIGNVSAGYDSYITTNQVCLDVNDLLDNGQWFYTSTNEGGWRLLNIEQSIRP